jgi:hypothetical protein
MTGNASDFFEAFTGASDEVESAIFEAGSLGAPDLWHATEKAVNDNKAMSNAKLKFFSILFIIPDLLLIFSQ